MATPARILLVEDDSDTRQLLVLAFEARGFQVAEAMDGHEGLRQLEEQRFDLVITDYDMPGKTGSQMLRDAAARGLHSPHGALIITAHPEPEGVGQTPVLKKPLDLEKLLVQVTSILRERSGASSWPAEAPPRPATDKASRLEDSALLDLALYVSPTSLASIRARARIENILEQCDTTRIEFEVCDLLKHAQQAERDRVLFTPTLVKRRPAPMAWILGDMSDPAVLLDLLGLCGVRRKEDP